MRLKLEIDNNNFIYKDISYPIIETFIDFIDSYGGGLAEKAIDLLSDLQDTKNTDEYYSWLEEKNFSIFYLPLLSIPSFNNDEDFNYWIEDTSAELQFLSDYIAKFKQAIDICFNLSINTYDDLSFEQKYALCVFSGLLPKNFYTINRFVELDYSSNINFLSNNTIKNNYDVIKKKGKVKLIRYIEFSDINSMCLFAFNKMLEQNTIIKNCKNCKKLFVADNKKMYCNRVQSNGLKCSQIDYSFREKKKNDLLLQEYMKSYKRVQNFYYKNKTNISIDLKNKLFAEIRRIYDKAQNDNSNSTKYIKLLEKFNYKDLENKYLK